MRVSKTNPGYVKTALYGEVEKALRSGTGEIVFSFSRNGERRKTLLAMHMLGDRIMFFDPELNPELSYSADLGPAGTAVEGMPGYRYEGNGLHSLERAYLKDLFFTNKAWALVPVAYMMRVAS